MTRTYFKSSKSLIQQAGFTLVELMVTVSIIAVLASFAIPFYEKFAFRAKVTEAKTMMASLYSSEKAFYSEYLAYHVMFQAVGFAPEGNIRFNIGFSMFCDTSTSAGLANGYTVAFPIVSNGCNTSTYCRTFNGDLGVGGNSCFLMQSYGQSVVPIQAGFTVSPTGFVIGATIGTTGSIATNSAGPTQKMQAFFGAAVNNLYAMSPPPIYRTVSSGAISLNSEKKFNEKICTYTYDSNAPYSWSVGPRADANGDLTCPPANEALQTP